MEVHMLGSFNRLGCKFERHTETHREYLADKKHDVLGGELSPPGCHILCLMDLHDHKQQR
jgi:hypothetical protein